MDEWILLNEKEYYSTGKYHTFNTLDDALASEITGSVMTKDQYKRLYKKETEGCHHCLAVGYHEEWCDYKSKER
jgi:hypothetical protein